MEDSCPGNKEAMLIEERGYDRSTVQNIQPLRPISSNSLCYTLYSLRPGNQSDTVKDDFFS